MVDQGPLIGRECELAELEGMLDDSRLLTVTGAGGAGKTRLALALADRLRSGGGFRSGELRSGEQECVIVPLASAAGEHDLLDVLLGALGARERVGSTPMQVLVERAASLRAVVVLDNCEHLLAPLSALVGEMLEAAPHVQVLMTSREPLQLPVERVLQLDPLSVPEADDLAALVRSDAARLFVDRAARSDPEFALTPACAPAIAEVCRQLDGLPLALVLAAARLDTLTVEEIARGLSADGRLSTAPNATEPSQHRSLRASLDWSYRLLDEREQLMLRSVSTFSGGFTTSAAAAVLPPEAAAEKDTTGVRGLLEGLERKQLVRRDPQAQRWSLLQTVAEYAAERLADAGESEQAADLHMRFFCGRAASADSLLLEAGGHALIDHDRANLRLALVRALAVDYGIALEAAAALMCDWILAEHYREARFACASVLAAAGEQGDASARAVVHCGAGLVAVLCEDYDGAIAHTRSGLALAEKVSDDAVKARCLQFSSTVLLQTGVDAEGGMDNAERAVQLARAGGDRLSLAFALVNLAVSLMLCGRFDTIERVYEEFLQVPRACEHPRLRIWAEHSMAWVQLNAGSLPGALEHADLALRLEGDVPSMTHFQGVGFRIHALARIGRTDEAIAEGVDALRSARASGALMAIPAIELALMVAYFMGGDLDAAHDHAGDLLEMPHLHTLALAHETLGRIALMRGELDEAHVQAGKLQALAQRFASPRQRAIADCIRARAALQDGETSSARELLYAALETFAELGLRHDLADVLDDLAISALGLPHRGTKISAATIRKAKANATTRRGLQMGRALEPRGVGAPAHVRGQRPPSPAAVESIERAARLCGAAVAARQQLGCIAGPDIRERLTEALRWVDRCEQDERWKEAWKQGEALTSAEAVAYASRGRGPRGRPLGGWASLTPTEFQVADLAAAGLSNPQIAKQLFISRGTVKMHLSSVYRKLDVANRTELATAFARRATAPARQTTSE